MAHAFAVTLLAASAQIAAAVAVSNKHSFKDSQNLEPAPGRESCKKLSQFMVGKGGCVHSNLGGFGPDSGREFLEFSNVFPFHTEQVDLRIFVSNGRQAS